MTGTIFSHYFVLGSLLLTALLCIRFRKLSFAGAAWAVVLGLILYWSTGYASLVMLAVFFLSATIATAYRKKEKAAMLGRTLHEERRNAWQVLANGGVALIAGAGSLVLPYSNFPFTLLIAAALSSATSDTFSSELGMVWGKRFFNITTFRKEPPGADGVISWEGLLAGLLGAATIGGVFYFFNRNFSSAMVVIAAGMLGNISDSLLGAWLERKQMLGNDAVNFLNTLVAAVVALVFFLFT